MPTAVKRIEKDFLLKAILDEKTSLRYSKDRQRYVLLVEEIRKDGLLLRSDESLDGVGLSGKITLTFDHNGSSMLFETSVIGTRGTELVCSIPEVINKDLGRTDIRVNLPRDMTVSVAFSGPRYKLPFQKLRQYHPVGPGPSGIENLKARFEAMAKEQGWEPKTVLARQKSDLVRPEERLIAHTGRTLFLPRVGQGFPSEGAPPCDDIITEEVFLRFLLESEGIEGGDAAANMRNFIGGKKFSGIGSEAWVPILFQEYMVGYVHLAGRGKVSVGEDALRLAREYTRALAIMLEEKGRFAQARMSSAPFEAAALDISSSGLLICCRLPEIAGKLMVNSCLKVTISTAGWKMATLAAISRIQKDKTSVSAGCRFVGMKPEDGERLLTCLHGSRRQGQP